MKLRSLLRRRLLRHFSLAWGMQAWLRQRFTGPGRLLLGALLICALLGLNTRQVLIYQLFGLAAGLLLVAWVWTLPWGWWRRPPGLQLSRRLPPQASVGSPLHFHYHISHQGQHTLHGLRLLERGRDPRPSNLQFANALEPDAARRNRFDRAIGYYRWAWLVRMNRLCQIEELHLPPIPPGAGLQLPHHCTPHARGHLLLEGVWLVRTDPLGLMRQLDLIELRSDCQILPHVQTLALPALAHARHAQKGTAARQLPGDGEEFIGLRDYRPGDNLRMVHWKSFARLGRPVVREYQTEYCTRHLLVLDHAGAPAGLALETAISCAASLLLQLERGELLFDLIYLAQQPMLATCGPGHLQLPAMLHILSDLHICAPTAQPPLHNMLQSLFPQWSAGLYLMLEADAHRVAQLQILRERGLPLSVWLVADSAPPDLPDWITLITPQAAQEAE